MSKRPQLFGKTLFVDLMMGTLVVMTAWMMASNAYEKQKKVVEDSGLTTEGKFAVIMDWPNKSNDDVDLHVCDPNGNVAYFRSRDPGLMHLEHDDLGSRGDRANSSTGEVEVDSNEERVIIRGIIPGEYVVNVHMYHKDDPEPIPVTVRLMKLKGMDNELVSRTRELSFNGEEQTAFRFTLHEDKSVTDINELPKSLLGQPLDTGGN